MERNPMENAARMLTEPIAEMQSKLIEVALKLPGMSEATRSAYGLDVRQFAEWAKRAGRAIGDVSTLEAFKQSIMKSGLRPTTVNRKLCAVKRTLQEFARREFQELGAEALRGMQKEVKLVKLNPTEKHVSREKLLTPTEAKRLMDGAPERIRLMMEFLFQTGARVSEALGVKLGDIRRANGFSEVIVIGKGQKARTLFVKTELIERITSKFRGKRYLFETRSGGQFDRTYVRREFVRASERELGKRVTPHGARHSFATWTIAKTKKVKGLSEYLGHADVSTTLNLYVHESLNPEELLGPEE